MNFYTEHIIRKVFVVNKTFIFQYLILLISKEPNEIIVVLMKVSNILLIGNFNIYIYIYKSRFIIS